MTEYDDVAKCKLVLDLSTEQLESIENNGTSDAKAGRLFGDMNDADDLTEEPKAKLNNQTVTALNEIIVSLKNKPVDPVLLDKILNGTIKAPSSLMERFGTLFFSLVKSQINVGKETMERPSMLTRWAILCATLLKNFSSTDSAMIQKWTSIKRGLLSREMNSTRNCPSMTSCLTKMKPLRNASGTS